MNRSLIVARILPHAAARVGEIFAESDATDLPEIAGVARRELYVLGDLYVHLLETAEPGAAAIGTAQQHPEFARVSSRLGEFISPYLATWKSPADARAHMFYSWTPQTGPTLEIPNRSASDVDTKWNEEK
ncbi:TcmI family type II polyketide cyclase [Nocardia sp. NBC_00565]|uniref:TcmI family type II polyketide cyclase n=1 Tax=Nocardia sp. NBC_00565 TaxID=2975993 RepID=UPI002E80C52C|nr:TcmI family type II polyketide cyclase [Nocardia sp. NBC_00565]WUC07578.1 TcmI family type II polyketide cyclase [Nocardia sp. NBC_00565]